MADADGRDPSGLTTRGLATACGYSVQQVRDLERLGVLPPAVRRPNGYRQFTDVHVTALRAYRRLATAVGPVGARAVMRQTRDLPREEATARIVALHVELAQAWRDTTAAIEALDDVVVESSRDAPAIPTDTMSVTELSEALGLRSSTLRFWEREGLVRPERRDASAPRRYPPDAVRETRIVAALRAGGYGIPAVRAVMTSLRTLDRDTDAREALQARRRSIAARSDALLRAGADLADLLRGRTDDSGGRGSTDPA